MAYRPGQDYRILLKKDFRFVHEPLTGENRRHDGRFIGRSAEADRLVRRLQLCDGGAFLVTGYRGVGKTSFINEVLHRIRRQMPDSDVIVVRLNLARPLKPVELMHHILRGLNAELRAEKITRYLDRYLRTELKIAVRRTSFAIARKGSVGIEGSKGLGLSLNAEEQSTYLAYDDKAAEDDLLRIARLLVRPYRRRRFPWIPLGGVDRPLKIFLVFDELDKLDSPAYIDRILSALKNLFTTSGISFLFVGGKDLHDRWREDLGKGDSIFESVFAYHIYLSCLWHDTSALCASLFELEEEENEFREDFERFLSFEGRGIPRRLFRVLHEHVSFDEEMPAIVLSPRDQQRVESLAVLQENIDRKSERLFPHYEGSKQDQFRLAVYHLIDWIIQRGQDDFSKKDLGDAAAQLNVKLSLSPAAIPAVVDRIIDFLIETKYIEQISSAEITRQGEGPAEARYVLAMEKLAGVASSTPAEPESGSSATVDIPGYAILRQIGSGGTATVYEAIHIETGRTVALKVMHHHLASDDRLRKRFQEEAKRLREFQVAVPRCWESGEIKGRCWIAMEYIDGASLRTILRYEPRLPAEIIAAIGVQIKKGIREIHKAGWVRIDLKPGNIRINNEGRVTMIDLGTLLRTGEGGWAEQPGGFSGTLLYSAPEQIKGNRVRELSDSYSLAVMLNEMREGQRPFEGADVSDVLRAQQTIQSGPLAYSLQARAGLEEAAPGEYDGTAELRQFIARFLGVREIADQSTVFHSGPAVESITAPASIQEFQGNLPCFEYIGEDGEPQRIPLDFSGGKVLTIGRQGTISLAHVSLSRNHAQIMETEDGQYVIQDLNSSNGTFVNDHQCRKEPLRLADRDEIRLGNFKVIFREGTSSQKSSTSPEVGPIMDHPPSDRTSVDKPLHPVDTELHQIRAVE